MMHWLKWSSFYCARYGYLVTRSKFSFSLQTGVCSVSGVVKCLLLQFLNVCVFLTVVELSFRVVLLQKSFLLMVLLSHGTNYVVPSFILLLKMCNIRLVLLPLYVVYILLYPGTVVCAVVVSYKIMYEMCVQSPYRN